MKATHSGIFLLSLAIILYEILLTRIFSVTIWYHFAFLAISIAMFGLAVGAVLVYRRPQSYSADLVHQKLALNSLAFAVLTSLSFLFFIQIPIKMSSGPANTFFLLLHFLVVALPFVPAGIVVCATLTKFPSKTHSLYAADLLGAALGCLVLIGLLSLTDAPTTVFIVSSLSSLSAFVFSLNARKYLLSSLLITLGFSAFTIYHYKAAAEGNPPVRLRWVKGAEEPLPLYEKWNSHSRIRVLGDASKPLEEDLYGSEWSTNLPESAEMLQLILDIDAIASTQLMKFTGDLSQVEFLKYSLVNLAHHVKPDADVLVVGVGGGRDVLSALVFEQKSVTGIELNRDILKTTLERYGEFTGNLDDYPNVNLLHDEARSFVASSREKYDLIQVSLIDTWAATAAGAFALSENSLYTREGWNIFLSHLNEAGLLSFSRWFDQQNPAESLRLLSLARESLNSMGIASPRDHILMASGKRIGHPGMVNLIVSKTPLSTETIERFKEATSALGFEVILSPEQAMSEDFARIVDPATASQVINSSIFDLSAPTDDRPYFFQMVKIQDIFRINSIGADENSTNTKAVGVIVALLVIVSILTTLCILVPLRRTADRSALKGATPLFSYFGFIGLGFMLLELAQLQRLILLLGHPTYSLSIVLFTLLLSSSLGSFWSKRISSLRLYFLLLILSTSLGVVLTLHLSEILSTLSIEWRALFAALVTFCMGIFMGMAFPIGMRFTRGARESISPWLWGINSATSVCASVLAVALSISLGITVTAAIAVSCYALAGISIARLYYNAKDDSISEL